MGVLDSINNNETGARWSQEAAILLETADQNQFAIKFGEETMPLDINDGNGFITVHTVLTTVEGGIAKHVEGNLLSLRDGKFYEDGSDTPIGQDQFVYVKLNVDDILMGNACAKQPKDKPADLDAIPVNAYYSHAFKRFADNFEPEFEKFLAEKNADLNNLDPYTAAQLLSIKQNKDTADKQILCQSQLEKTVQGVLQNFIRDIQPAILGDKPDIGAMIDNTTLGAALGIVGLGIFTEIRGRRSEALNKANPDHPWQVHREKLKKKFPLLNEKDLAVVRAYISQSPKDVRSQLAEYLKNPKSSQHALSDISRQYPKLFKYLADEHLSDHLKASSQGKAFNKNFGRQMALLLLADATMSALNGEFSTANIKMNIITAAAGMAAGKGAGKILTMMGDRLPSKITLHTGYRGFNYVLVRSATNYIPFAVAITLMEAADNQTFSPASLAASLGLTAGTGVVANGLVQGIAHVFGKALPFLKSNWVTGSITVVAQVILADVLGDEIARYFDGKDLVATLNESADLIKQERKKLVTPDAKSGEESGVFRKAIDESIAKAGLDPQDFQHNQAAEFEVAINRLKALRLADSKPGKIIADYQKKLNQAKKTLEISLANLEYNKIAATGAAAKFQQSERGLGNADVDLEDSAVLAKSRQAAIATYIKSIGEAYTQYAADFNTETALVEDPLLALMAQKQFRTASLQGALMAEALEHHIDQQGPDAVKLYISLQMSNDTKLHTIEEKTVKANKKAPDSFFNMNPEQKRAYVLNTLHGPGDEEGINFDYLLGASFTEIDNVSAAIAWANADKKLPEDMPEEQRLAYLEALLNPHEEYAYQAIEEEGQKL